MRRCWYREYSVGDDEYVVDNENENDNNNDDDML